MLQVGNRKFSNFEGESPGPVDLAKGLAVSCDTMWYGIADTFWRKDGGLEPVAKPKDPFEKMAKSFGYGKRTGIDLPSESRGRVGGRAFKTALNEQLHDAWCQRAVTGYPEVAKTDQKRATYLKALAKENCADGGVFRIGDAVNLSIGQGDTVVTPLQVAQAYAALANGGTIYQPQVAKGIVGSDGKVVSLIKPKVTGKLPVSKAHLAFLRDAFSQVTSKPYGTGYNAFRGFPLDQIPVAAKTGTGQAARAGDQSTSWFATFAPANKPKYAVVMMVSQGGTGAGTSAPSVRKIYEAIYGIKGRTIDPSRSVLVGGAPSSTLPTIRKDGTPVYPEMPKAAAPSTPAATPSTGATTSTGTATSGFALPVLMLGGLLGRRARRRGSAVAGADEDEVAMTLAYPSAGTQAPRRPGGSMWLRKYDLTLIACALALSLIGGMLVWSATKGKLIGFETDPEAYLKKHVINLVIGLALGAAGLAVRLPAAARLHADPVRRLDPRSARRALAARLHHQRREGLDLAAGRLHDPAVGVREDRDHPRDVDDPLGEARRRERAARHRRALCARRGRRADRAR